MELHEMLYSLRWTIGEQTFEDPDGFRAAIDDFLDEGAASTGQINLLVDAMRFGAYRRMISMIDNGADPAAAVEAGGELLARERGTMDRAGSNWACAVLGYAAGKVQAGEVDRFRLDTPLSDSGSVPPGFPVGSTPPPGPTPPPAAPTTTAPPGAFPPGAVTYVPGVQGPSPQPGSVGGQWQSGQQPPPPDESGGQPGPGGSVAPPPGGPWGGSQAPPPVPPGGWRQAPDGQYFSPPPAKRKVPWVPLIAVAAVVVLVGVVAAVVIVIRSGGGAEPDAAGTSPTAVTLDQVAEDYQALGANLTAGADQCEPAEPVGTETERVTCEVTDGQLELVTYGSSTDLTADRADVVDFTTGTRYSEQDNGIFYSHTPGHGQGAVLYWDDVGANQAASVQADPGVPVARLHGWFRVVDAPGIEFPVTAPGNTDLAAFLDQFGNRHCEWDKTLWDGATETDYCSTRVSGAFVSAFDDRAGMLAARRSMLAEARANGRRPGTWTPAGENAAAGAFAMWYDEHDDYRPRMYIDDPACLCVVWTYSLDASDYYDDLRRDWNFTTR